MTDLIYISMLVHDIMISLLYQIKDVPAMVAAQEVFSALLDRKVFEQDAAESTLLKQVVRALHNSVKVRCFL